MTTPSPAAPGADDLDDLEAKARAATPGPWSMETMRPHTLGPAWVNALEVEHIASCGNARAKTPHGFCGVVDFEQTEANAAYIAAACNAVPDLIARLRAAEERVDEAEERIYEPWPEWADECLKIVREFSGKDSFDDESEGVDLPEELRETLSYFEEDATRVQGKLTAAEARVEKAEAERDRAKNTLSLHAGDVMSLSTEIETLRANHADELAAAQQRIEALEAALKGVVKVADRKTVEFDDARKALEGSK